MTVLVIGLATVALAAPATVTVTAPADATAGETVNVTFDLTNDGSQASAYILDISLPAGWVVVNHTDDGGTWNSDETKWLWQTVEAGSTVSPTVSLSVPTTADGSYEVQAVAKDSSGVVAEESATITVGSGGATESSTAEQTQTGTTMIATTTRPGTDTSTTGPTTDDGATPTESGKTAIGSRETAGNARTESGTPPATDEGSGGLPLALVGGLLVVAVSVGFYWRQQTADSGWSPPDDDYAPDEQNYDTEPTSVDYDDGDTAGQGPAGDVSPSEALDEAQRHADTAERRQDRGDLEGAIDAWEKAVNAAQRARTAASGTTARTDASSALDEYRSERDAVQRQLDIVAELEEKVAAGERHFRSGDEAMDEGRAEAAVEKYRKARDRFQDAVDLATRKDIEEFTFTAEGFRVRSLNDIKSRRDAAKRSYERHKED